MTPTTFDIDQFATRPIETESAYWAPGYYSSDFEERVNSDLDKLSALEENWDLEGAKRIDEKIIAAARKFIAELPDNICKTPAVVPSADGNLQFEWSKGSRLLELEIETPGVIHYLKWHPEEGVEEEDVFDIDDIDQAVLLIQWFMRG
jgi:hypothetical protein